MSELGYLQTKIRENGEVILKLKQELVSLKNSIRPLDRQNEQLRKYIDKKLTENEELIKTIQQLNPETVMKQVNKEVSHIVKKHMDKSVVILASNTNKEINKFKGELQDTEQKIIKKVNDRTTELVTIIFKNLFSDFAFKVQGVLREKKLVDKPFITNIMYGKLSSGEDVETGVIYADKVITIDVGYGLYKKMKKQFKKQSGTRGKNENKTS